MKTKIKIYTTLVIAILFTLQSCKPDETYTRISGETQGTTYNIIYNKGEMLKKQIDSLLHNFDMSLSTYIDGTIISKVNQNEEVILDAYFITVFEKSMEISENTGGMFDITVAPLINAYGFGFTEETGVSDTIIDSLLQFVGFDKIKLENNKIIKTDPRVMIDCNAIAQGYAVDIVADFLDKKGCNNYMIEIGGELITKGQNEFGENWKIGIDKPIEGSNTETRQIQTIVTISDKAMATSGDYRRYKVKDGVKYSHSINPKTGKTTHDNLLSVTILADDCMTADGYATACMIVGLEKATEIVNNYDGMEAYFIFSGQNGEFEVYFTEGFNKFILE